MKLLLVDDNAAFRKSLKTFLEGHLKHTVIGEYNNGKDFIENGPLKAEIILMDINMPELNGLQATKKSTWENQDIKIIAVSQYKENVDIKQLIGAGFKGFVSKQNLFRDLENAIVTVSKKGYFFPDELNISTSLE